MAVDIRVPQLPESVADATILTWYKQPGEFISRDEKLVDIETDKVVLEIPAPDHGVLDTIIEVSGSTVTANQLIAKFTPKENNSEDSSAKITKLDESSESNQPETQLSTELVSGPAARRAALVHTVDISSVEGSGKRGRITKSDVLRTVQSLDRTSVMSTLHNGTRPERRVAMSRLRARIAERLLSVQQSTASLTTFNEINLAQVMTLRSRYKEDFEKSHGVKLGFMSLFTRAVVEALKRFPTVNASIDGQDVIYHGYYDIGIAVSTERGLVVPVIRDADSKTLADIEQTIADYAIKAKDNKITMDEMTGGTFTITNGGVFGSLLSTPILNPPQSAILGMHRIEQRPVVERDEIVVRPMMYVALTYDHRIIDGKDSVSFLTTVKRLLEEPERLLLDL